MHLPRGADCAADLDGGVGTRSDEVARPDERFEEDVVAPVLMDQRGAWWPRRACRSRPALPKSTSTARRFLRLCPRPRDAHGDRLADMAHLPPASTGCSEGLKPASRAARIGATPARSAAANTRRSAPAASHADQTRMRDRAAQEGDLKHPGPLIPRRIWPRPRMKRSSSLRRTPRRPPLHADAAIQRFAACGAPVIALSRRPAVMVLEHLGIGVEAPAGVRSGRGTAKRSAVTTVPPFSTAGTRARASWRTVRSASRPGCSAPISSLEPQHRGAMRADHRDHLLQFSSSASTLVMAEGQREILLPREEVVLGIVRMCLRRAARLWQGGVVAMMSAPQPSVHHPHRSPAAPCGRRSASHADIHLQPRAPALPAPPDAARRGDRRSRRDARPKHAPQPTSP